MTIAQGFNRGWRFEVCRVPEGRGETRVVSDNPSGMCWSVCGSACRSPAFSVPERRGDNSPAFQRRGANRKTNPVPKGRMTIAHGFSRGWRFEMETTNSISAVPAGLDVVLPTPGVETPGYGRVVPPGRWRGVGVETPRRHGGGVGTPRWQGGGVGRPRFVPKGRGDNSPAFQRRVANRKTNPVPKGRMTIAQGFNRGWRFEMETTNSISAVPAGLDVMLPTPGVETPGYGRVVPPGRIRKWRVSQPPGGWLISGSASGTPPQPCRPCLIGRRLQTADRKWQ